MGSNRQLMGPLQPMGPLQTTYGPQQTTYGPPTDNLSIPKKTCGHPTTYGYGHLWDILWTPYRQPKDLFQTYWPPSVNQMGPFQTTYEHHKNLLTPTGNLRTTPNNLWTPYRQPIHPYHPRTTPDNLWTSYRQPIHPYRQSTDHSRQPVDTIQTTYSLLQATYRPLQTTCGHHTDNLFTPTDNLYTTPDNLKAPYRQPIYPYNLRTTPDNLWAPYRQPIHPYRQPVDTIQTTYWPPTDNLWTARQLMDHPQTTYGPPIANLGSWNGDAKSLPLWRKTWCHCHRIQHNLFQ